MHLGEILGRYTVNDIAYIVLHSLLLISFIYGVYVQYIKHRVHQSLSFVKSKLRSISHPIKNRARIFLNTFKKSTQLIIYRVFHRKNPPTQVIEASIKGSMGMTGTVNAAVIRGDASWVYFIQAWTVLSLIFTNADAMYTGLDKHNISIVPMLVDVLMITWLCFGSGWFRDQVIKLVNWRSRTPD